MNRKTLSVRGLSDDLWILIDNARDEPIAQGTRQSQVLEGARFLARKHNGLCQILVHNRDGELENEYFYGYPQAHIGGG